MKLLINVNKTLNDDGIIQKTKLALGSQFNNFKVNDINLLEKKETLELLFDFTLLCGFNQESPQSEKKFQESLKTILRDKKLKLSFEKNKNSSKKEEKNTELTF